MDKDRANWEERIWKGKTKVVYFRADFKIDELRFAQATILKLYPEAKELRVETHLARILKVLLNDVNSLRGHFKNISKEKEDAEQ